MDEVSRCEKKLERDMMASSSWSLQIGEPKNYTIDLLPRLNDHGSLIGLLKLNIFIIFLRPVPESP